MNRLTVLYDRNCDFCLRVRNWLASEPRFIDLEFLARQSDKVLIRYPRFALEQGQSPGELIVISDVGEVYLDTRAMVMCLYALRRYRGLALRLGQPGMMHLTHGVYGMIAKRRLLHLRRMQNQDDAQLQRAFAQDPLAKRDCTTSLCHVSEQR